MEHIDTSILGPAELHKVGVIFSHETTADNKLVNHAINKTLDRMETGRANDTVSLEEYDAIVAVCDATPVVGEKMNVAYKGMTNRLDRQAGRAARAAERQGDSQEKRAAQNLQRACEQSAKRSSQGRNDKILQEIQQADQGEGHLLETAVSKLMVGPVVIMTKKVKVN